MSRQEDRTKTKTREYFNRCAQCGDALLAPVWSEFVKERCIRHLWNCDACGYSFETTVYFPAQAVAEHDRVDSKAA
ncbi:MAG TPA: hypothetical protein VNK48_10120 [Xanthobacteraceae bacterium]|nr:hypothetical protein [Xanthobacteraceae bacterium]